MQLERVLNGLGDLLEQYELTGIRVGSTVFCSGLYDAQIYASFVVKGIRYIRDDWMSSDGVPSIQLVGDYFGPSGVQICYIVLSRDDGAALKLYKGLDDFASGQKPLSLICETVLLP